MLVFDRSTWASSNPPQEAVFAATATGDRLFDLRYPETLTVTLDGYHTQLAALRKDKAKYTKAIYREALSHLEQYRLMPTRSVWATDGQHTTWAFFDSDALTGHLALLKYFTLGWNSGLDLPNDDRAVSQVWTLATQLRALLADRRASETDTTYEGRPALLVAVPATATDPAWQAVVDRQYGLALAVRVLGSPKSQDSSDLVGFRLERWTVNESLPAATFAVRPDYRHAKAPRGIKVQSEDLSQGEVVHVYPPAGLDGVAADDTVAPTWLPSGWHLAEAVHIGSDRRQPPLLVYRCGLSELLVGSGALVSDEGDASGKPTPVAAFDRGDWPDLSGYDRFVTVQAGVLRGSHAVFGAGIDSDAALHAWTDNRVVDVSGDLTEDQLLAVADSLHVRRAGSWGRSLDGTLSLGALLAAIVVGLATAGYWIAVQQRESASRASLQNLAWPLIATGLVVVGAVLDWHALRHAPGGFALRCFSEPLGRLVVALALAAAIACAWRQLAADGRRRRLAKTAAILLASAALAGAVLALVYLPPQARFTFMGAAGNVIPNPPPEGLLVRTFLSQSSPSAASGLLLALLGALFLVVGVVMLRGPESRLSRGDAN